MPAQYGRLANGRLNGVTAKAERVRAGARMAKAGIGVAHEIGVRTENFPLRGRGGKHGHSPIPFARRLRVRPLSMLAHRLGPLVPVIRNALTLAGPELGLKDPGKTK